MHEDKIATKSWTL